jgi:hypothetical protein
MTKLNNGICEMNSDELDQVATIRANGNYGSAGK